MDGLFALLLLIMLVEKGQCNLKPDVPFPFIDQCGEVNNECYGEVFVPNIQCSVRGIRPSISLSLIRRTLYGEEVLSNHTLTISEGVGYTNIVAIDDVFHYSSRLVVLVCKAFSLPGLLEKNESKILVLNAMVELKKVKPKLVSVKQDKYLELKCSGKETGIVVWKKANAVDYMEQEVLVYSVNISKPFSKIIASGFSFGDNLSLLFHSIRVQHEGLYFCIFGDGLRDDLVAYNVTIIIPAYPMIDGCNQQQYCVLKAEYEGSLTCAVKGIRPEVQLQWKTFSEGDKTSIYFTSQRLTVIENNDSFDITLVSQYQVRMDAHEKITLECEVVASEKDLRGLSKKMDLLFMTGVNQTPPTTSLAIVTIAISLVLVTCGLLIIKLKLRKRTTSTAYVGNVNEMAGMCRHNPPEASTSSDGFDEYPDQESSTSDVISIIERHMFQTVDVFLTTRSFCLPKKYPPSTKRFRLTGFDDNARRHYIRNTVIGDDDGNGGDNIVEQIEGRMKKNPILRDAVLQFAAKCDRLQWLWLAGSVPPMSFDDGTTLSELIDKNVTVIYSGVFDESSEFVLDLLTGLWKTLVTSMECTAEDFEKMESDWKKYEHEEDTYKSEVKKYREDLSKIAKDEKQRTDKDDEQKKKKK